MDRHITLLRRPYICWEPGMIRCPGLFEFCWRGGRAFGVGLTHQGRDRDDGYAWSFSIRFLMLSLSISFPGPSWEICGEGGCIAYGEREHWGFTAFFDDLSGLHLNWGLRTKVLHWPWSPEFHRHEVRRPGGEWVVADRRLRKQDRPTTIEASLDRIELSRAIIDQAERFALPYRYVLNSGEVQDRVATIFVERRFWRPRWLRWTSLFEKCSTVIDVMFSDEVGERSGSWKGGCIGCGYAMRPGETAEETLRRMEAERTF